MDSVFIEENDLNYCLEEKQYKSLYSSKLTVIRTSSILNNPNSHSRLTGYNNLEDYLSNIEIPPLYNTSYLFISGTCQSGFPCYHDVIIRGIHIKMDGHKIRNKLKVYKQTQHSAYKHFKNQTLENIHNYLYDMGMIKFNIENNIYPTIKKTIYNNTNIDTTNIDTTNIDTTNIDTTNKINNNNYKNINNYKFKNIIKKKIIILPENSIKLITEEDEKDKKKLNKCLNNIYICCIIC